MFKIWAKVMADDKIRTQFMYKNDGIFLPEDFQIYMTDICYVLNLPSPLVINAYIRDFCEFNHMRFKPSDFVEKIDFDAFVVERC
jgi:hypothetical protein